MGKLEDWIHIEAIQVITHHASAALVAVVVFGVVGRLIARLMPDGHARRIVIVIDDVVLIMVLALFGWELLVYLWGRHLVILNRPGFLQKWLESFMPLPRWARLASTR